MSAVPDDWKWEPQFLAGEDEENLEHVVQQAVGTASVCWDELPRGIFDDRMASAVSRGVVAWVNEHYVPRSQVRPVGEARTATTGRRRVQDNPQA